MSQIIQSQIVKGTNNDERIFARLDVEVSWQDSVSGQKRKVTGNTVNIGSSSAFVSIHTLPPVGEPVSLRIFKGDKELLLTKARVIRVERDPAKPKAALNIEKDFSKWKDEVIPAAQDWVSNDIKLNYEGDDWLN
ncbi:MAG: PilZ domain-containing protein [Pyrinomonadaceae bacterium]